MENKNLKILSSLRIATFILLIILISVLLHKNGLGDIENVKKTISDMGILGPLVYILMFSILPTFFVTVTILAMAAGYVFGFPLASLYTFIGAFINSTITYYIGKYIAHDFVLDIVREKYSDLYEKLRAKSSGKEGFVFMMMLRLLPLIPYTFLNYMSGVVGYDYLVFISATMIGIIPGLLAYVNMGDSLGMVGSIRFYVAIFIFIALALVTTIIGKRMYGKEFFKND